MLNAKFDDLVLPLSSSDFSPSSLPAYFAGDSVLLSRRSTPERATSAISASVLDRYGAKLRDFWVFTSRDSPCALSPLRCSFGCLPVCRCLSAPAACFCIRRTYTLADGQTRCPSLIPRSWYNLVSYLKSRSDKYLGKFMNLT